MLLGSLFGSLGESWVEDEGVVGFEVDGLFPMVVKRRPARKRWGLLELVTHILPNLVLSAARRVLVG